MSVQLRTDHTLLFVHLSNTYTEKFGRWGGGGVVVEKREWDIVLYMNDKASNVLLQLTEFQYKDSNTVPSFYFCNFYYHLILFANFLFLYFFEGGTALGAHMCSHFLRNGSIFCRFLGKISRESMVMFFFFVTHGYLFLR